MIMGMPNPGYELKFTADGYAPFVSRAMAPGEGDVEINASLHRAESTTVTVYKPDGQLAPGADVGLVFPGAELKLAVGGFQHNNNGSGGALLRTEKDGTFVLQPDDAVNRVIAISPDGYAEATPSELVTNPMIQLQTWGRLELTCSSGGTSAPGREYGVDFSDMPFDSVAFPFDAFRAKTDADGKLTLEKLPPRTLKLARYRGPGHGGFMRTPEATIDIKPGETTTLTLGASDYIVKAHIAWSAGVQRQANWNFFAGVHTPMPALPPEVMTNEAARQAFMQSPEFAKFKEAQSHGQHYIGTVNDDDTVTVESVPPGDYELSISASAPPAGNTPDAQGVMQYKAVAYGGSKLTVPTDPPTGTLDLGTIEMKATPSAP
jgi:hypothetical protein